MKVFCTKYALTTGIVYCEMEHIGSYWYHKSKNLHIQAQNSEVFLTEEEAQIKAEKMRQQRLESLEKSITKLKTKQIRIKTGF